MCSYCDEFKRVNLKSYSNQADRGLLGLEIYLYASSGNLTVQTVTGEAFLSFSIENYFKFCPYCGRNLKMQPSA